MNYEKRVRELESEGMTRSDAQAVADAEEMRRADNHGDVLYAYIARLNGKDLDAINAALRECSIASLQYGLNAQITAQNKAQKACRDAIHNMLPHDIANIETIAKAKSL